jgi:hypothetical protein
MSDENFIFASARRTPWTAVQPLHLETEPAQSIKSTWAVDIGLAGDLEQACRPARSGVCSDRRSSDGR